MASYPCMMVSGNLWGLQALKSVHKNTKWRELDDNFTYERITNPINLAICVKLYILYKKWFQCIVVCADNIICKVLVNNCGFLYYGYVILHIVLSILFHACSCTFTIAIRIRHLVLSLWHSITDKNQHEGLK